MKSLALAVLGMLSVCAAAAPAQPAKPPGSPPATGPASRPAPPEPEVRSFEVTPVAPPTPAMKYHLMFTFDQRLPGNAAMTYAGAVMLLRPDSNETADKALAALD